MYNAGISQVLLKNGGRGVNSGRVRRIKLLLLQA
jgi:hypothetical protein